jgi:hypothetical protein
MILPRQRRTSITAGHELGQTFGTPHGDGGTLAELYNKLIGDDATKAWPNFKAAVEALPDGVMTRSVPSPEALSLTESNESVMDQREGCAPNVSGRAALAALDMVRLRSRRSRKGNPCPRSPQIKPNKIDNAPRSFPSPHRTPG